MLSNATRTVSLPKPPGACGVCDIIHYVQLYFLSIVWLHLGDETGGTVILATGRAIRWCTVAKERRWYVSKPPFKEGNMLYKPEEGQGLVEYALILVLIAIAVIAILSVLGTNVSRVFSRISSGLGR